MFALVQLLLLMSNRGGLMKDHMRSFDECNFGATRGQTGDIMQEDRIDYVPLYQALAYYHWLCTIYEQVYVKKGTLCRIVPE